MFLFKQDRVVNDASSSVLANRSMVKQIDFLVIFTKQDKTKDHDGDVISLILRKASLRDQPTNGPLKWKRAALWLGGLGFETWP